MRQPVLFFISFVFLSLLIGFNLYYSFHHFGELVYPLDDAYIHMAISKNLQQHGIWGVTKFDFSSTSSSILYTLVLTLSFALFGIKAWLPLVINWIVAGAILWLTTKIALRFMKPLAALLFNLLFIALVPVSGMAMLGMEHTLQIFFCTLFLWQTWKKWHGEGVNDFLYALIAMLAVSTRYESAFLVGWVALFAFFSNKKQSVLLSVAIAVPIILFGWYAISHGGFFLPNSLIAKSNYVNGGISGFIAEVSKKILFNSLLAALIVIPVLYWLVKPVKTWEQLKHSCSHQVMLIIALTCIAHQVLASFGWMFRYEAYLIALLFVGIAITLEDWKEVFVKQAFLSKAIVLMMGAFLMFPILSRFEVPSFANRAIKNIHDQQLQMARFVNENFPSSGVAMNDIGTTTFYNNDIHLFDMEGLGTLDVLKIKKQFDSTWLKNYTALHHIDIGIFYPQLYQGKIPSSWQMVGSWEIRDRFVSAGSEVGFFSIDPASKEKLVEALKRYHNKLPADVIQKGVYTQQNDY